MIDLELLSLKELKQLQKDVNAAITNFKDRERQKAIAEVEAFARERGLSQADLKALLSRSKKGLPAKYANPEDPTQTWSGRGRRPRWVEAALASGKSLDDLKI